MHATAEAVAAGAPGWLNLGVLGLGWDAIKLMLLGLRTLMLWIGSLGRPKARHNLGDDASIRASANVAPTLVR